LDPYIFPSYPDLSKFKMYTQQWKK
jgi:hypothetical protein